jgi:hypothetical protein
MRKQLLAGGATFLLALFAVPHVIAEEVVAVVDLKFLKETDQTAAVLCLGESDEDEDCVVWAHHYLWEARIRKVIAGAVTEKRFLVLFGRHALMKKDIRNIVVLMKRLESNSPAEARYQILEWGHKRQLVCFSAEIARQAPWKLGSPGGDAINCFEADNAAQ